MIYYGKTIYTHKYIRMACFLERMNLVNLHVLIEGDGNPIELTDFTIKTFGKRRQTSRSTLAYPQIQKPHIILEGIIDLHTDGKEKQNALKLAQWALVPADKISAYKKVVVSRYVIEQLDEQISFERGFILNYEEKFKDTAGTKSFKITLAEAVEFIN